MKVHPYAELFPPIDEAALRALADDIARNGQREPIWTLDGQILDGRNRWKACEMARVVPKTLEYTGDDPLSFVISLNLRRRQLSPSQLAIIGIEIEAHRAKETERHKSERCRAAASLRARDPSGRLGPAINLIPQRVGEPGHTAASASTREASATRNPARASARGSPSRGAESARQAAKQIGINHDYVSKAKRIAREAPELLELVKSGALKLPDASLLIKVPYEQRVQILAARQAGESIRDAIARLRVKPNAPPDRAAQGIADELSHLRDSFMRVLAGCMDSPNVELKPLADCVRAFQIEIEKAKQARKSRSTR